MADIKLTRPAAGQNVVILSARDARMVLDFPTDQISIERPQNSDSLFFRFDDGGSIELQNFYTQYHKDDVPSFEVDGQLIAGTEFFDVFGPDLVPAAGPSSVARGGGYQEYSELNIGHGVGALGGVDLQFDSASQSEATFPSLGQQPRAVVAAAAVGQSAPSTLFNISGEATTEGSSGVVFNVALSKPPVGSATAVITVAGKDYDVAIGADGKGTLTVANPNAEDVYKDASDLTATVKSVTGGGYSEVTIGNAGTATAHIADTIDTTTVHLSATDSITEAGGQVTYTATLDAAAKGTVTVSLSNGQTITIADGKTSGSVQLTVPPQDDVYTENKSINASITKAEGGSFEKLAVDATPATTKITDTIDTTTAHVALSQTPGSNDVTATISLSNAPQNDTQITYTVNGVEHTAMIKGGATSTQADLGDLLVSNPSLVTVSAQITNVTGGNFEDVKWSSSSTDLRLDHPVLVGNSGVTVNENDLPGGTSPDVPALVQTGTVTVAAQDGVSNIKIGDTLVYSNGALVSGAVARVSGGELSVTGFNATTGELSYSFKLAGSLSHDKATHDASLSNTVSVTVTDRDGDTGTGNVSITVLDDAPKAAVTTTSTTTNTSIGSDIPIRFVYSEMDGNNKIGHTMPKGDINSANDFPDYVKDAMQGVTVSSATVTYSGTSAIGSIVSGGTLYSKNMSGGNANNMSYDGLGVDTDKNSGVDTRTDLGRESIGYSNDRLGELNFAKTSGYGISEAVVFDLPSGKTASSFSISLGAMQAGEKEVALISFYRNGVLVNSIKAAATDTSTAVQNFTFSSSAIGGAYDKVVVSALDDKNTSSSDNSDFTIQAVTFGGASTGVLETATGTVSGVSADGIVSIAFDSAHSQVTLAGGAIMTLAVSSDGKSVTGSVGGSTYFTATLSGVVNGQATWTFNQVHGFEVPSGSSLLNFTVTDGDGDVTTAATTPATITTPPVAMADTDTVNHGDSVVHGNVLTNDFDADGNHLAVVGVSAGSDASTSTAAGSTVAGQYGSITINADGSYSYNLDNSNAAVKAMDGASLTDTFNYRISDGHGGYATTTLKVNINDGKYSVDAKNDDTAISGGSGSDVLVGDAGGTSTSVVHGVSPVNYDVCIILDTSGSMGDTISGTTRLALAKSALTNLLTGFKDHTGIVNVNLIGFSDTVSINLEALEASKKSDGSYLDTIINTLASANAYGGTNYEAAFKAAVDWFSGKAGDNNTKLAYFLSDGVPTARTDSGSVDYGYWSGYDYNPYAGQQMSRAEFTEALAQYQKLVDAHVQVNAIGIGSGIDAAVLKYFDNTPVAGGVVASTTTNFYGSLYENRFSYTGNAGAVSIINNAAQLTAALNAGTPDELLVNLQAVGKDSVTGGDGNDIVFGDAVTANWLLDDTSWTSAGRSALHPGDSLDIVREYVLGTTLKGTTLKGSALESAISEAIAHELTEHSMKYGLSETARGGDDTLSGGNGDDILFGQGGADKLDGGAGHDLLAGGSGNDILTGGDGADVFLFHPGSGSDIITDYNAAQGDVIVRLGDPAAGDSIKNSSNVNIDTPDSVHTVVDVQQGHSIILSDSANHMLVGSGVSTDGNHYTSTGDLGGTYDNVLVGGDGNNVIYGGSGNNYLAGGTGNDHIIGGSGDDYLFGGSGNNNLYGGAGNDHLYGGADTDRLYGEEGNDYLDGGGSSGTGDFLYGGAGNDVLVFHKGDTIDGGTGTDVLLVKGGSLDELFGADGKLDSNITNTEVLVSGNDASTMESLTDVSKLSAIGLTVGADGKVTTANTGNATWSTAATQPHDGYDVMTCTISHTDHTTEEMTVAVLKVMHNS